MTLNSYAAACRVEGALQAAEKMEVALLACIPYTNLKDTHLSKVLCFTAEGEYVVWTFNSQDGGFHHGHYFRDMSIALEWLTRAAIEIGHN